MTSPDLTAERSAPSDPIAQSRGAVRRAAPWVLALSLGFGAAAGALTAVPSTTYVSTVSLVVQTTSGASDTETLIRTMQALVDSDIVGADLAQASGSDLTASEVVERLSVERPPGAGVLSVEVADGDAARSRRLAEQLIPVFTARVAELAQPVAGAPPVEYSIRPWGSGTVDTVEQGRPVVRNAALGVVLGGLISLVLVAVRASARPVLLTPAQARSAYRLPLLGALPGVRAGGPDPLDSLTAVLAGGRSPDWPLRPRRLLVVGSPDLRDRAVLLVDLACVLHPTGQALLVDTAGGRRSLTSLLGVTGRPGLAEALAGAGTAELQVPFGEAAGAPPPEPGALRVLPRGVAALSRQDGTALADLVTRSSQDQAVVVDAPRLRGPLTWSALLEQVDAVLVLGTLSRTRVRDARAIGDALLAGASCPVAVLLLESERLLVPAASATELAPPSGASPTSATPQDPGRHRHRHRHRRSAPARGPATRSRRLDLDRSRLGISPAAARSRTCGCCGRPGR